MSLYRLYSIKRSNQWGRITKDTATYVGELGTWEFTLPIITTWSFSDMVLTCQTSTRDKNYTCQIWQRVDRERFRVCIKLNGTYVNSSNDLDIIDYIFLDR